jgi:hypothetical protein
MATQVLSQSLSNENLFILLELLRDPEIKVRKAAIAIAKKAKRPQTWPLLIDLLTSPVYNQYALNALVDSGEEVLPALEHIFHKAGGNKILLQKIIQIYGLIGSEKAIELLWHKIEYPDAKIVIATLSVLKSHNFQAVGEKAATIHRLLEAEISKAAWNQAALLELADAFYNNALKTAVQEEMDSNFSRIFILLSLIYNPESIQLVKENVESGTSEGKVYALELLDVFIDKHLKSILFPLLDDIPAAEEISIYQAYFPREVLSSTEVLLHIINRDYNSINRWTKACALYSISMTPDIKITHDLTAQIFNPDLLLRQTAAWAIYKLDAQAYKKISARLPLPIQNELNPVILHLEDLYEKRTNTNLILYQILFLKQIPLLAVLPGLLLVELAGSIQKIYVKEGDILINRDQSNIPIYLIISGLVKWYNEHGIIQTAGERDLIGESLILDTDVNAYEVTAMEDTELYSIQKDKFFSLIATEPNIMQQFLESLNKKYVLTTAEEV